MNKTLLCAAMALAISACQAPQVVAVTPPDAYLHLQPLPRVPDNTANQLALVNYIFQLHDAAVACRQQIKLIDLYVKQGGKDARQSH